MIAFCDEAITVVDSSSLSEKNKTTAKANLKALYQPFLPPFVHTNVQDWFRSAMSDTNQSYFDLLSDTIVSEHPIYLPETKDIDKYKADLQSILADLEKVGLPQWVYRAFQDSVSLTLLAIDKLPFLAHKIIQDAHNTVLARLFSVTTPEHRKFMVRVATTMNIIFTAFVMPHEASEAAQSYYGWVLESPVDVRQIEACSQPLALPPPSKEAGGAKGAKL